jgi:hypothetical protein
VALSLKNMTPQQVEERFQRIEALLAETAARQAQTEVNLGKTEAIANSNARAIAANSNENAETRAILREVSQVLLQFMQATNSRLSMLKDAN